VLERGLYRTVKQLACRNIPPTIPDVQTVHVWLIVNPLKVGGYYLYHQIYIEKCKVLSKDFSYSLYMALGTNRNCFLIQNQMDFIIET
jgi:hypothetical protein